MEFNNHSRNHEWIEFPGRLTVLRNVSWLLIRKAATHKQLYQITEQHKSVREG